MLDIDPSQIINPDHMTRSRWQAGLLWYDQVMEYYQFYMNYWTEEVTFASHLSKSK